MGCCCCWISAKGDIEGCVEECWVEVFMGLCGLVNIGRQVVKGVGIGEGNGIRNGKCMMVERNGFC